MGTHVGTHIDALGHVSHQGLLFGGQAAVVDDSGGFSRHGVHMIPPMVRRGVLLDVPPTLGREVCEAAYLITPDDLDAAVRQQGIEIRAADIVLIRTGWGRRFAQGAEEYLGVATGVPGIGEAGARWLVDRHVHAVGSDTIAFEHLSPGGGHRLLPVHRMLLVDAGTYIIEALSLEELADARVFEFTIVLVPLKIVGATGSPVRPLAVVADD
jgi:kynurenine formamidase